MSYQYITILFPADESEAKSAFNELESRYELTLYRLKPDRWAIFVCANDWTVQWNEALRLVSQLSQITQMALIEFCSSIAGLQHQLFRRGDLVFDSGRPDRRSHDFAPTAEELFGPIPLRAQKRTSNEENISDVVLWKDTAEFVDRSYPIGKRRR